MKRWFTVAALLLSMFGFGGRARAADWSIRSFASDITINADASIDVTETIGVDFAIAKHGIYRTIPVQYQTEQGTVRVPIDVPAVSMDGQPVSAQQSTSGDNLVLKIGDPNRTITGPHVYDITYHARAVVNFFSDHDELYWNVTGNDWEVPLSNVSATVRFATGMDGTFTKERCLTGPSGSTAEDCQWQTVGQAVKATAQDAMTIVVAWPKGLVTKYADYDSLRTPQSALSSLPFRSLSSAQFSFVLAGNVLAAVLIVIGFAWWWFRHGRDPRSHATAMVQYDPPDKLRPGEVGTLYDERAQTRDVIATIIDMAVRGHLSITETVKDKMLGLAHEKDYRLKRGVPSPNDAPLKPYEQALMDGLFSDGDEVTMSSLKGSFHDDIQLVKARLYDQLTDDGYFAADPDTVRRVFYIAGAILFIGGFFLVPFYVFVLPLAGVLAMLMAKAMPQRTMKGVDATWHAHGFREYLEKAEKYRLQWQEKEKIFELFLPYAMAFGVAQQWTNAFKDIAMPPPSWYHGSPGSTFSSLVLWSSLSNFTTVAARSFVPPASTGSSGFGGGGFSGGGFGGGGGGSW